MKFYLTACTTENSDSGLKYSHPWMGRCLAALHFPPPCMSCCQHWAGMSSFDPFLYTCWRAGLGNPPLCCVLARNVMIAITAPNFSAFEDLIQTKKTPKNFLCKVTFPFWLTFNEEQWLVCLTFWTCELQKITTDDHFQKALWHERACMSPLLLLRHGSASYNRVSDYYSRHANTGKKIICWGM